MHRFWIVNLEHGVVIVVACIKIFVIIFWGKVYVDHCDTCFVFQQSIAVVTRDVCFFKNYSLPSLLISDAGTSNIVTMASILKALGFEGKPDYSETIPETLVNSDFAVHQVSTFLAMKVSHALACEG